MAMNSADIFRTIEPIVAEYVGLDEGKSQEAIYSKVFKVTDWDRPVKDYTEYGGTGPFSEKDESEPLVEDKIIQGWSTRWIVKTFGSVLVISREAVKDTRYDDIKRSAGNFGRAGKQTPEFQAALFLDRAFNSSYPVIGDKKELCNTTHTTPRGAGYSNMLSNAMELSEEGIEQAMINLELMTGHDDMPLPIKGAKLVFHPANSVLAWKLNATRQSIGSAINDKSYVAGKLDPVSWPHLGNKLPWFITTSVTEEEEDGLFFAYRERVQFMRDNKALTLQALFYAFYRAMWGCKNGRGIYGSNAS